MTRRELLPDGSFMYMFKNVTLSEAIENYLYWKSSYLLVATDRYGVRLEHFKNHIGSHYAVKKITINDIIAFHKEMEGEQGYSKATVAYSARILKNFFEYVQGQGIPSVNPSEIRPMKYISPEKDIVTPALFKKMDDSLHDWFYADLVRKLIIHMLYDTGMRVSELCELNISDIEPVQENGLRCASIRRRKSLRYNTVVWGKETDRLLNLYLGIRLCFDQGDPDALFITRRTKGKRITTRTVQRWIEKVCKYAGIEKEITPHSFRHGKAHQVLNQSGNVRDVQAILGHESPQSSFSYLSLNRQNQIAVSEKYLNCEQPLAA